MSTTEERMLKRLNDEIGFFTRYRANPINANRTAFYDEMIERQRTAISAIETCRQLKKSLFDKENVTDKELVSAILKLKSEVERVMSEYYLDEEFPTFGNPETYEAFQQFAEKWRSSTFKELQFQVENLQNENNRLKAQIKELSLVKKNWDEKIKEIRGARLKELLKDVQECAYLVDYEYEYAHVKCDKCDVERKIHFKSPSGKELTEPCPCSSQVERYFLREIPIYRIKIYNHYGKEEVDTMYIYRKGESEDTYYASDFRDALDNETISKNRPYRPIFLNKERAENYARFKNAAEEEL